LLKKKIDFTESSAWVFPSGRILILECVCVGIYVTTGKSLTIKKTIRCRIPYFTTLVERKNERKIDRYIDR
jgi:hypothetical protein